MCENGSTPVIQYVKHHPQHLYNSLVEQNSSTKNEAKIQNKSSMI